MNDRTAHDPPAAPDVTGKRWESLHKRDAVDYDPESETYHTSFDNATQSVTETIISTVAVVSETPPLELPPLCSIIDPEAVEAVVDRQDTEPARSDTRVSFTYVGYTITVYSYGTITVQQRGDSDFPAPSGGL